MRSHKVAGTICVVLMVAFMVAGTIAHAAWKPTRWNYSPSDLSGTSNILDAIDDIDTRLDNMGISTTNGTFTDNIVPATDSTYTLGASGANWSMLYVDDITVGTDTGVYSTVTIDTSGLSTTVLYIASGVITNATQ